MIEEGRLFFIIHLYRIKHKRSKKLCSAEDATLGFLESSQANLNIINLNSTTQMLYTYIHTCDMSGKGRHETSGPSSRAIS